MKKILLSLAVVFLLGSCVSKKDYVTLEATHQKTKDELLAVKTNLTKCLIETEKNQATASSYKSKITDLETTVKDLQKDKRKTLEFVDNLTVLTKGANDNIKETLIQLSKKDQYIKYIRKAMTKKDSLNLAVAFNLKKELKEGLDDQDIKINVEKTVVFISISDKLLFKSGSYNVTDKAYKVLEKVATVINGQPNMDVMVEGHTDSKTIKTEFLEDNWDLSAKRATSIVRILQNKFKVTPGRLIAAGRSSYVPLAPNDTEANMAKNRRTKIIIMPRLDQFFDLLEEKAE
ncbi:Outer membrane porin F [Polaribacter huanghezhanensis]|uniref:OmpA/MotB family protein n=1 Tax=Polaribacter huanghezhanensis TaxID=1354726 RepID=UPI0026472809|nr:flagellar motor protein MotB [Polaribacter huanghezhanensis]WKD85101.1 Outer membrane porin F [Polaribacter huanghezhanensis]